MMLRWRDWLGLNSSTMALLVTILLVTLSTELWSPVVPEYLKQLQQQVMGGDLRIILLIGAYGFCRDALEAINYYVGGAVSGRFNTRRSLLLFNMLPLVGLGLLAVWASPIAVFLSIPFVFVWDSIAAPAIITVVGDAVPADRRTMAFSMQAIFRRTSRIVAYGVCAIFLWLLGTMGGVRTTAVLAGILVLVATVVQYRFMGTVSRDRSVAIHRPLRLLARFSPELKRLLASDVCSRWAEGLAIQFIILYCVPILSNVPKDGAAAYTSILLNIQAVTNIILYVIIGPLASREGLAKKPYIGLTFLFFALFPVCLVLFGNLWGPVGLALAFVVGGLREIGEPARKAMVAELVPADVKTQAIGLYWSTRSVSVMWASPVGAVLWLLGQRWRPGMGPVLTFGAAGLVGLLGAIMFFARFGRGSEKGKR